MKNLLILILFISVNLVLGQEKKKEDPEKKDKKTIAELVIETTDTSSVNLIPNP